ncbi:DUF6941 family protein [Pseudomonas koreensis]|uniref:DUF6941 family protein n=1 Tax=Pseudomonas koreensis TaxID=198620 RepID=UPI0020779AA6|nr:hypothetical protein [Pseudomonas koreensis]MCM8742381.1 hypothetical protein [Pseudomonas koreensis]
MTRFAYSIFCDDIRNEVNGKISLMGIFGNLMYLPEFPAVLPKLCAVLTVNTSKDRPLQSVSFRGIMDENVIFEMALDAGQIEQMRQQGAGLIDDPKGFEAKAMIVLSPLHLAAPTKIKVSIVADGEEIECAGLQISKAPEGLQII